MPSLGVTSDDVKTLVQISTTVVQSFVEHDGPLFLCRWRSCPQAQSTSIAPLALHRSVLVRLQLDWLACSTGRHLFFCNKKHFLSAILIDFRTETAVGIPVVTGSTITSWTCMASMVLHTFPLCTTGTDVDPRTRDESLRLAKKKSSL